MLCVSVFVVIWVCECGCVGVNVCVVVWMSVCVGEWVCVYVYGCGCACVERVCVYVLCVWNVW